jgi:non-heme chloroperoxidase
MLFVGWYAVVTVRHLRKGSWIAALAALCGVILQAQLPIDPTPHTVQFITVDRTGGNDVKLEVLDWGGSGRPVVLLAGLGNNAHVYDKLAPKLIGAYHVYGITRRGYGASNAPSPTSVNYAADRLGDDVLAVMDALKLNKPVLVGHSLGGEELSSLGSRHPEKVAGLIYLDAAYSYAYSAGHSLGNPPSPPATAEPEPSIEQAILAGAQQYTDIRVLILAIYAFPHDRGPEFLKDDPKARAAFEANELESLGALIKAFETGLPSARVVRLPHANHYVFRSNEADVLREMNAFIGSLP